MGSNPDPPTGLPDPKPSRKPALWIEGDPSQTERIRQALAAAGLRMVVWDSLCPDLEGACPVYPVGSNIAAPDVVLWVSADQADQAGLALETWLRIRPGEPQSVESLESLHRWEWAYIQRVLSHCGGNISATARRLGIHRRSLQRKLAKAPPGR